MSTAKKGPSIGASLRGRMASEQVQEAPPARPAVQIQAASADPVEVLESMNTRIPRPLFRRLKLYAARDNLKMQDVVRGALEAYLQEK